jgi:hypothetical protein
MHVRVWMEVKRVCPSALDFFIQERMEKEREREGSVRKRQPEMHQITDQACKVQPSHRSRVRFNSSRILIRVRARCADASFQVVFDTVDEMDEPVAG